MQTKLQIKAVDTGVLLYFFLVALASLAILVYNFFWLDNVVNLNVQYIVLLVTSAFGLIIWRKEKVR